MPNNMHIERLKTLVVSLNNVEAQHNDSLLQENDINNQLMKVRNNLLMTGKINGRNKEIRDAQLYPYIEELLTQKAMTQKELKNSEVELNHLKRLYEVSLLEAKQ